MENSQYGQDDRQAASEIFTMMVKISGQVSLGWNNLENHLLNEISEDLLLVCLVFYVHLLK